MPIRPTRHLLFALLTLAPSLLAAQAERATPSEASASAASAAPFASARLARVDNWINGLVVEKKIPGAVVMLVRDGRVAYHKAYGVRDLGTGAPQRTL